MNDAFDDVRIGLVSVSDRASTGVYEDKGLPALKDWLTRALKNPITFEARLIPDEQQGISDGQPVQRTRRAEDQPTVGQRDDRNQYPQWPPGVVVRYRALREERDHAVTDRKENRQQPAP